MVSRAPSGPAPNPSPRITLPKASSSRRPSAVQHVLVTLRPEQEPTAEPAAPHCCLSPCRGVRGAAGGGGGPAVIPVQSHAATGALTPSVQVSLFPRLLPGPVRLATRWEALTASSTHTVSPFWWSVISRPFRAQFKHDLRGGALPETPQEAVNSPPQLLLHELSASQGA